MAAERALRADRSMGAEDLKNDIVGRGLRKEKGGGVDGEGEGEKEGRRSQKGSRGEKDPKLPPLSVPLQSFSSPHN
jgi:hypothetical protein